MTSNLKIVNNLLAKNSLGDFLPYVAEEDGIFINKNSSGFVFKAVPILGSDPSCEQKLHALFKNELPPDSSIQFMLIASDKVGELLKDWQDARKDSAMVFKKLAAKRVKHFTNIAKPSATQDLVVRNFFLLISVSIPGANLNPVEINDLNALRLRISTLFNSVNMQCESLDAQSLIKELHPLFNPNSNINYREFNYNPHEPINEQLIDFDTELQVTTKELTFITTDTNIVKIYGIKSYPREWTLAEMNRFVGEYLQGGTQIVTPFVLHYGVHILDEKTLKSKMLAKCANIEKQANSPIGKWIPSIVTEAKEWGYCREQIEKGERFVSSQFKILLYAKPQDIEIAESRLKSLFQSAGWSVASEKFTILPSFMSCMPLMWGEGAHYDQKQFGKIKTTLSHEPVNVLPIQGEWLGSNTPSMLFAGIRGQVFYFDCFDNLAGNFNISVAGKSGSGKSVCMQELVTSNLSLGGRAFVLDVGHSFERLVKLLGGSYIEFTTRSQICVNPFTHIPLEPADETLLALTMVKPIIALMAAPLRGTNDLENSLIEQAIQNVWGKLKNKATIDDVATNLALIDDPRAHDLSTMLYPYTKQGVYSSFFNGVCNVDLSANMVVLEMEELKERHDLQAVMVQIMVLQVTNAVYMGDRTTKAQLVIDEAWDLLRGGQSGLFIETAARRLRKYNGALIVGTQSVNDFYANPGAQAAFENSDWLILLEQKGSSISHLKNSKRIGDISGFMEKMLKNVHTIKGKYAECFIHGPRGFAVGRLILDRYSQLLYTTDPKEFTKIRNLLDLGVELSAALEQLSDE
jgi:conjugal transfer ATP-binding protein TraC